MDKRFLMKQDKCNPYLDTGKTLITAAAAAMTATKSRVAKVLDFISPDGLSCR